MEIRRTTRQIKKRSLPFMKRPAALWQKMGTPTNGSTATPAPISWKRIWRRAVVTSV